MQEQKKQIGSGRTRIRRGPDVLQGHVAPRRATEPDRILLTVGHQPITHCMPLARRTRIEAGMFVVRALYVQLACVLLLSFIRCSRGTVWFEGWEMEHVNVVGVGWYICNTSI